MTPSLRTYLLLNRLWFFGMIVLVMILAWLGAELVPIVLMGVGFAAVAITVLNPHRSWWGPEVHAMIGNQQAVRRWAKQDLILFGVLIVGGPIVLLILTAWFGTAPSGP